MFLWFRKRHEVKMLRRYVEEGGPMTALLHYLTLGPLKGYRTAIGIFLYLYANVGITHGWPGAGTDLLTLAESIIGLGVAGKLSPQGDVGKPAA